MTPEPPTPGSGDVQPLQRQLLQHAQLLAQLRHEVDQLAHAAADTYTDLLARLDDLTGNHPGADPASDTPGDTNIDSTMTAAPWCWRDLEPAGQDQLWALLRPWVTWLRSRYPLARRVPDCWPEHPEAVEELTALWVAWQAAYQHAPTPTSALADWHDRLLPGLLHRLEHGPLALPCRTSHQPRPPSAYLVSETSAEAGTAGS